MSTVNCFCGNPVAVLTSNTAANPGRRFERCANYQCTYWDWRTNEDGTPATRCRCNRVMRVFTAGPSAMPHNHGREFGRCAHPVKDQRCKFFLWCDDEDSQELFNEYMDARFSAFVY
ncbi:hypothetical protein C8R45DRAFT_945647 [Mycena sanguinolenta]|nr:hypothetical protein C8R45DRAFT_945647 [Mycena sanguinolenta]